MKGRDGDMGWMGRGREKKGGGRERGREKEEGREEENERRKEKESKEEGGKDKEKLRGVKVLLNGRGEDKGCWRVGEGGTTERRLRGQRNGGRKTGKGD